MQFIIHFKELPLRNKFLMEHFHFLWYNETITLILHDIEICAETNFGMVAKFCSTQNEINDCILTYELGLLTEMDNLIFKVDFTLPPPKKISLIFTPVKYTFFLPGFPFKGYRLILISYSSFWWVWTFSNTWSV